MDLKDGQMKKMIFNELEYIYFQNHFALTIQARRPTIKAKNELSEDIR